MKLKELKAKNFAKFTDFEMSFNGQNRHLVGVNGAGKSSVFTMLWACLKGIAERPKPGQLIGERFRFIGASKASSDLEVLLIDDNGNEIKVTNRITKQGNQIEVTPVQDENWLISLFNATLLSAKNFCSISVGTLP